MARTQYSHICERCGNPYHSQMRRQRFCSPRCVYPSRETSFWEKVDRSGGPDACWLFLADLDKDGYGIFRNHRAHRVSWEVAHGPIPAGLKVCHNCPTGDNPSCVNPAHLFLGTTADNNRDMHEKGRHPHGDAHPSRLRPETRPRGSAHRMAVLNEATVRAIRTESAAGAKGVDLAARYGVTPSTIWLVVHRKKWAHVPD